MRRSLITPRRALVGVVLALLVASFLGEGLADAITRAPRTLVTTALNPLTQPLLAFSRTVRSERNEPHAWSEQRLSRRELEEELGRAMRRLEQLRQEHEQLQREHALVTQTREQIELSGVRLVNARVTAYTGDPAAPVLTLERGTRAGLREGTVIASGFNLVGRVVHAGPMTADVRLIIAPGTELQVTIRPPEVDDEARRTQVHLAARDDGAFEVRVPARSEIEPNDLAQLSDPRWPREARGFVVGQVTRVEPAPDDPFAFRDVLIEPIPPLSALPDVTAVVEAE